MSDSNSYRHHTVPVALASAQTSAFRQAIPFALIATVIVIGSLSTTYSPESFGVWDKLAHVVAYGAATIFAIFGFKNLRRQIFATAALVALAGLLEVFQSLIPGRLGDVVDFLVSALGIAGGLALVFGIGALVRMRHKSTG